jgi:hypothetical protein
VPAGVDDVAAAAGARLVAGVAAAGNFVAGGGAAVAAGVDDVAAAAGAGLVAGVDDVAAAAGAAGARLVAGGFAAGNFVAGGGAAVAAGVDDVAAAAGARLVAGVDDVAAAAGACLVAADTAMGALRFLRDDFPGGFPPPSSSATGPCRVFGDMRGWCARGSIDCNVMILINEWRVLEGGIMMQFAQNCVGGNIFWFIST